jgi:hypothetical protein
MTKEQVLNALHSFIKQRPGLEFGNYGDVSAYRAEMRQITKDRHHAETLLSAVARNDSITAEQIIRASKHAYSGRLSIETTNNGSVRIDYCTGQYFPTEYRRAVCAVLASALWDYARDTLDLMPLDDNDTVSAGYKLRHYFKRQFGRNIASRWFE